MSRARPSASATRAPPSGRWSGAGAEIVAEANGAVPLSVAIAAAFGCPFEGEAGTELVARLAGEAYDGGAVEISLAESIGVGVPAQVRAPWRLRCRGDRSRGTWRGRRDARLGRVKPEGLSLRWRIIGRNKKSITLNLRSAQGQEIVRKLVAQADVLVENFRPGTLERWGLSPEELWKVNRGLVVTRVTGYGQTGSYAPRPASASLARQWADSGT
ncbi:Formyl-CoA:oxalate CoA-transferase [Streptomyces alboniger]